MEAGLRRRRGRWEGDATATEEVYINHPEGSGANAAPCLATVPSARRVFREAGEDMKATLLRLSDRILGSHQKEPMKEPEGGGSQPSCLQKRLTSVMRRRLFTL